MFNLTAQSMFAFDLWVVSSNHTCTFYLFFGFVSHMCNFGAKNTGW